MPSKHTKISKKKATALVTGGAGFIGSNLVAKLIELGYMVHIIDDISWGKRSLINPKAVFHEIDIRDLDAVMKVFEKIKPDYVYHLAAHSRVRTSVKDPLDSFSRNATGTSNILEASRQSRVKRLVFTSSSAVYGTRKDMPFSEEMVVNPESPYGVHKYLGEMKCRLYTNLYGLPTVILRCFNAYGLNQPPEGANATVIPIFLSQRKAGESLTILGNGEQSRDFIHVDDLVSAIIKAMEHPKLGHAEIINVGSGEPISIKQIAELIGGPIDYKKVESEQLHTWADIKKAKKMLGWKPKVGLKAEIKKFKKEWGIR